VHLVKSPVTHSGTRAWYKEEENVLYAVALAAALGGPDARSIFAHAALAWEARPSPAYVTWSLDVRLAGSRAERRACALTPQKAGAACTAPDGSPLFFDESRNPFSAPAASYAVQLAATQTVDGAGVYDLKVSAPPSKPAAAPLSEVWVGTDDYEVRRLIYAGTAYTFARYGVQGIWWTQRAEGHWGSAQSVAVAFDAPDAPKTIASVRVTPLCSAVRATVLPFLSIERSNGSLIARMDDNVARFVEAAQLASDPGSPGLILSRANLDWYAAQMYDNLARADLLLKASYEKLPQGRDAPLDALRLRLQTLVDVERIAVNQYASLAAPRMTSYRYWNSMAAEVARLRESDGGSSDDAPPPQAYAGPWLFRQLTGERRDLRGPVMTAADYCGIRVP